MTIGAALLPPRWANGGDHRPTAPIAHPSLAPLTLPLAALVGYSRVALRVHHTGDVLAGFAIGLAGAAAAAALL